MEDHFTRWDSVYKEHEAESLPWFSNELDKDLDQELKVRGITRGTFLDVGTGPGTQAHALQRKGFEVIGTDLSPTAVGKATKLFPSVEFVQDDIIHTKIGKNFAYILDRGCFHTLPPEKREGYVKAVRKLIKEGGLLFLKCFSSRETEREKGPFRFSAKDIEDMFSHAFTIEKTQDSVFQGTSEPFPKALFVVLKPKPINTTIP